MAAEKLEGPSHRVTFLGIEVDTAVASAPEEYTGIEEPGWGMARAEIMPEEGITVLGGEAAACLQCG